MLGERLRVARARARKSLRDLGSECGVSAQAIKKYEDNLTMPSSSNLLKICALLDVSVEWLIAQEPLDFHSTEEAPQGRHAKYWVREAVNELILEGVINIATG